MKEAFFKTLLLTLLIVSPASISWAHFGVIIPSDDIVSKGDSKKIDLQIKFMHPFERQYMEMARPKAFGVMVNGKKHNLLSTLNRKKHLTGRKYRDFLHGMQLTGSRDRVIMYFMLSLPPTGNLRKRLL